MALLWHYLLKSGRTWGKASAEFFILNEKYVGEGIHITELYLSLYGFAT